MNKLLSISFLFLSLHSCTNQDYYKHGKLTFHATSTKEFFIFNVDDSFYKKYKNSANNSQHPRLSDEEYKMLIALLKKHEYCNKNSFQPKFEIISRQEKIYDATFASLIAKTINSKSLTPVSYYGSCL